MNGVALCAGAGGLELAVGLVVPDYRTVCYVEREAFAAARLVARMADGALAAAPIWDDLLTFDGRRWCGRVDLVTAGFPCQPWSAAGKGEGAEDERWIWPDVRDRIREMGPWIVFLENVPPLVSRGGLAVILGNLADLGFDADWVPVRAADVLASHERKRIFILAYRDRERLAQLGAALDHDGCHASGDDVDGCDPTVADSESDHRRRKQSERRPRGWRSGSSGECAPLEHAARVGSGWRPSDRRRQAKSRTEHASGTSAVADADRNRRRAGGISSRELPHPTPCDSPLGNSEGGGFGTVRQPSRSEERRLAHGTDEDVADADSGTVRVEPKRHQRDRRGTRTTEREHAEPRSDVPLFPPVPSDLERWRALLIERPDLAPAIRRDVVDTSRAVQYPEQKESAPTIGRWAIVETGARRSGASNGESDTQSAICGMAHGLADRVDRLRACGNGVVPLAAAYAFRTLIARALTNGDRE